MCHQLSNRMATLRKKKSISRKKRNKSPKSTIIIKIRCTIMLMIDYQNPDKKNNRRTSLNNNNSHKKINNPISNDNNNNNPKPHI